MNKEHPNISILKMFNPTDPNTVAEVLAEDFIWHYINPELPDMEGDYHGLSGLADFFKGIAGRTGGSFKVKPVSTVSMGDDIVVTHVKDTMILNGKQMKIDAIVVWCIIDGKIKEAWDIPVKHTARFSKL